MSIAGTTTWQLFFHMGYLRVEVSLSCHHVMFAMRRQVLLAHLGLEPDFIVHEIQVDFNHRQKSLLGDRFRAHLDDFAQITTHACVSPQTMAMEITQSVAKILLRI